MLDACARLGLDTTRILEAAKLDPVTLQDPDARVPIEQAGELWRKAYELSNDPNLALHAIEVLPFGAYRVFDFLASSAPTVGAALAKVSDYFPLINPVVRLPYVVGGRHVVYGVEAPSRPAALTRPYAEYTLAAIVLRTRVGTRQRYPLVRIEFSHPRPDDIREHERIFGCEVRFGADACRMVMTREVWDTPCTGDATLFSLLDAHARMLMEQLPAIGATGGVVGRASDAIQEELRGGDPKLETVAKRLAMSPRTLQRRLRDEGLVFNDVLDALRFRAAKSYLAQRDIAGTEVAYLLGFVEQSSFIRAFRRWSVQTPMEYRRSLSPQAKPLSPSGKPHHGASS
jgi:AraC-like DNA-binding protein